jgi:hypothetical protein
MKVTLFEKSTLVRTQFKYIPGWVGTVCITCTITTKLLFKILEKFLD